MGRSHELWAMRVATRSVCLGDRSCPMIRSVVSKCVRINKCDMGYKSPVVCLFSSVVNYYQVPCEVIWSSYTLYCAATEKNLIVIFFSSDLLYSPEHNLVLPNVVWHWLLGESVATDPRDGWVVTNRPPQLSHVRVYVFEYVCAPIMVDARLSYIAKSDSIAFITA